MANNMSSTQRILSCAFCRQCSKMRWPITMYFKRLLKQKKALTLYFADNSTEVACTLSVSKSMPINNQQLLAGKVVHRDALREQTFLTYYLCKDSLSFFSGEDAEISVQTLKAEMQMEIRETALLSWKPLYRSTVTLLEPRLKDAFFSQLLARSSKCVQKYQGKICAEQRSHFCFCDYLDIFSSKQYTKPGSKTTKMKLHSHHKEMFRSKSWTEDRYLTKF